MAKAINYEQVIDGEKFDVPPEWLVACCDCGLVHRFVYKFRRPKGKERLKTLTLTVYRESRLTAAKRKKMGIKIVKVQK